MAKLSNFKVSTTKDGKIRGFFIRSNRYLLEKYRIKFQDINDHRAKLQILESLWRDEFHTVLIIHNDAPIFLDFLDSRAMTVFFLRFYD